MRISTRCKMTAVAGMLLLSVTDARANPPADPSPNDLVNSTIESGVYSRLQITLYKMPPTRTYCTLDDTSGTATIRSAIMEWDPLRPGSLIREATVSQRTSYRLGCYSEPARHALDASVNFAWEFKGFGSNLKDLNFIDCSIPHLKDSSCFAGSLGRIQGISLPRIDNTQLEIQGGRGLLGPAARSFGTVPEEALNELFQVIAEVAVEKARAKGMKLLQTKIEMLVCDELKASKTASSAPLLPRTCESVRHLRLDDLAGTGQQVLDSLAEDFIRAALRDLMVDGGGFQGMQHLDTLVPVFAVAVQSAVDTLANRQESVAGAGQRILVGLSKVKWPEPAGACDAATAAKDPTCSMKTAANDVSEGIKLALAILAEVHKSGKVDASAIREMIERPALFFKDGKEDNSKLLKMWPGLPAWISTGARVLSPPPDTSEATQVRAALGLVFDLLDLYHSNVTTKQLLLPDCTKEKSRTDLRLARQLLTAALQQDLGRIASAAGELMSHRLDTDPETQENIVRVTKIAGALGAYLSTYSGSQKPSTEELKARHEARKAALSSLIDSQTERSTRHLPATVISVGSTLGFMAGTARLTEAVNSIGATEPVGTLQIQPSLTLGVAVDHHLSNHLGLHLEVAPFNIGNYLTWRQDTYSAADATRTNTPPSATPKAGVVPPSPSDILSPSLTLAGTYLVKDADLIVLFGATGGYSFRLGEDAKANRAAYFGGVLGVYIPFFDFN